MPSPHRISFAFALAFTAFAAPAAAAQALSPRRAEATLEVVSGAPARAQRAIAWDRAPPSRARVAFDRFSAEAGQGWLATWDADTAVPSRLFGPGIPAPGANASPERAEAFARAFLARHIALLAPGASPDDFVLASDDLDRGMRSIGFLQHHRGLRVLGGQVSFRFRNDRLFVIGSEALPDVAAPRAVAAPRTVAALEPAAARAIAERWIGSDRAGAARADAVEGPFVLPIVSGPGPARYHTILRVVVSADRPVGRFAVYLDADTGAPIAREQTLLFASGTLRLNVPVRSPQGERADYPARSAEVTINGAPITSDESGHLGWEGTSPGALEARLTGPLVTVLNAAGASAAASFTLANGGTAVWNAETVPTDDAQLNVYVHAQIVKAYARKLAPEMTWLDEPINATVNVDDRCNAFSDGTNIYFFQASDDCENTGRIADVVYHEFGHSLHYHAVIPGIGMFETGLSEGISDYLAATITGDAGMGRGFFYTDDPLRDIDPTDREFAWPDDISESHETGRIISGALWDLRKALVAKLGPEEGVAHTDQLFYQGIRRAVDVPSMFPEVLAADDDDGDLANGTPNACEIITAFGPHGIRVAYPELTSLSIEAPTLNGHSVSAKVNGLFAACPGDAIQDASVAWRLRDTPDTLHAVPMTEGPDGLVATIPVQASGEVVQYRVSIDLASGQRLSYPDNPADTLYEFYVGPVIPLYCTDFETDPADDGWTHGSARGEDDWSWAAPSSMPSSRDPTEAFSGARVFGNDLGVRSTEGSYTPRTMNFALSPRIETGGRRKMRLQYRRWLNIEDGFFDHATIYANDFSVWANLDSDRGEYYSNFAHTDREWRFQDVDLSPYISSGAVQLKFELSTDDDLELGGWTIDDLCVVAVASCGDGIVDDGEACDDGDDNSGTRADACRNDCKLPRCGDGVVDQGESCDGDDCEAGCDQLRGAVAPAPAQPGCSCEAAGAGASAPGPLAGAVALAALAAARRRRWSSGRFRA